MRYDVVCCFCMVSLLTNEKWHYFCDVIYIFDWSTGRAQNCSQRKVDDVQARSKL